MLEIIKFSEELSIYSTKIVGINNEELSKDLELNCDISNKVTGDNIPGIQTSIITTSKNILNLEIKITEIIKKFLNLEDDYVLLKLYWTFISDSFNRLSTYHDHITGYNIEHSKEIPKWTFVYYASFPDTLENTDGRLFFKLKSGEEFSILPEEGQLLIFPADILHRPALNKKSIKKRIVFAGNFASIDRNKKYSKKEKTIF